MMDWSYLFVLSETPLSVTFGHLKKFESSIFLKNCRNIFRFLKNLNFRIYLEQKSEITDIVRLGSMKWCKKSVLHEYYTE